jgi:hypothetical protein
LVLLRSVQEVVGVFVRFSYPSLILNYSTIWNPLWFLLSRLIELAWGP